MTLISMLKAPPGEFQYVQNQPRKVFPPSPLISDLANRVADFRKGNKLPGASPQAALVDIIAFNCARLGSQWCYDTDNTNAVVAKFMPRGCAGCGAKIA